MMPAVYAFCCVATADATQFLYDAQQLADVMKSLDLEPATR
jgi:hypothetical protein